MANQEKTAAELYREERKQRIAKAAKKNQKKSHKVVLSKKAKAGIAVLVVLAIAIGIGGFAVGNSGILQRGKVAFTVGDTEVTMAEYSYYYNSVFSQYFQYSYQYDSYYGTGMGAMYTGYDCSVSPDQQDYTLGEVEGVENPKWTDFFEYTARQNIRYIKACLAYAAENGIVLDEEDYAKADETMAQLEATADSNNYSLAAYIRASYGKAMSVGLLRTICEEQLLASKVQETKMDEYKSAYTDAKIEEVYKDEIKTYGVVSLRNYVINAETVSNEEEDTASVTDETMAAAKTKAEQFASKVSDDASFKNTAYDYEVLAGNEEAAKMKNDDSVTLVADTTYSDLSYNVTDEDFLEWAFDENTPVGETYVVENADTGYAVYMMSDPVHKAPVSKTYDVRHILVMFPKEETSTEETDSEETEEAKEEEEITVEMLDTSAYDVTVDIDVDIEKTGNKETYVKAQDILKEYLDGEHTEEAFGELAKKYSEDNADDGGLYTGVTEAQMVSEFENWSLAEGREVGDVGIVESTYGYHIMYHVGVEETTWSDAIKTDLATEEYNTFVEEVSNADNVAIANEVEDALAEVEDFVVKSAKTQIRNMQSSQAAYY